MGALSVRRHSPTSRHCSLAIKTDCARWGKFALTLFTERPRAHGIGRSGERLAGFALFFLGNGVVTILWVLLSSRWVLDGLRMAIQLPGRSERMLRVSSRTRGLGGDIFALGMLPSSKRG